MKHKYDFLKIITFLPDIFYCKYQIKKIYCIHKIYHLKTTSLLLSSIKIILRNNTPLLKKYYSMFIYLLFINSNFTYILKHFDRFAMQII